MHQIKDPQGIILLYGGRRLGKTALLYQAHKEVHDPAHGKIAIVISADKIEYKGVAELLSRELRKCKLVSDDTTNLTWDEIYNVLRDCLSIPEDKDS